LEPQVEEHHVEPAPLQGVQRAGRRADAQHPGVVRLQAQPEGLANAGIVVND
jgi:hypothetical protein